jgi:hypothetical protein
MEQKIKKIHENTAIIGIDFSINKPALSIYYKDKYKFICFPYEISSKNKEALLSCDIQVIERNDNKEKGDSISSKMRYEVINANYLAELIYKYIEIYLNSNSYVVFEGLSYASSGDVVLQLGGYKFLLMNKLSSKIPFCNIYTYSPLTVKATAGAAGRGKNKEDMINSFIKSSPDSRLRYVMLNNPEIIQKKTGKWIDNIDDVVDSYFIIQTLLSKENFL